MKIQLDKDAIMPERAHITDAGLDLRTPYDCYVGSGSQHIVDTGVHVAIPKGYVGLVTSKSGLMAKGITVRGTIDSGYTGSIRAVIFNHSEKGVWFNKGDKICQLVVLPIAVFDMELVDSLEETERGDNGFGSTGR